VVAAVGGLAASCGDDDATESREQVVADYAAGLSSTYGLDEEQSRCLAEEVVDSVGLDRLLEAGLDSDRTGEQLDEDIQADLVLATFDALERCGIDLTQLEE